LIPFNLINISGYINNAGVWQDGDMIFHFPDQDQWVGIFLRFQSQAWHTDDNTGHAIGVPTSGPPSDRMPMDRLGPHIFPTADRPDGFVKIIAAKVNDTHSPEQEIVTILNTSDMEINLSGWKIADKQKNKMSIEGNLKPGETKTITITNPVTLSNKGGIITLLDEKRLKVDGVAYTQARHPGWTITF